MKKIHIILVSEGPDKISVDIDNSNFAAITPGVPNSQENIMLQLIDSNPSLVESDHEIKAWKEQFDAIHVTEGQVEQEEQTGQEEHVELVKKVLKKKEGVAQEEKQEEQVESKKGPFGKSKKNSFEGVTNENLADAVKELGITVSSQEQLIPTLLKSYEAQRKNALKAFELEVQVKEYNEFIGGLPPKLKSTLKVYADGGSWEESLSGADPNNYDKSFDSLNATERVTAVKSLLGIDISKDDITKDENANTIKLVEKAYSIKQQELKLSADKIKSNSREQAKERDNRIATSIENLKSSLPDIEEEYVLEVENLIKNNGIGTLFTDKQGNLLPDVAKKILFVLYGDSLLENSTGSAAAKSANAEREKIVKANISAGAGGKSNSKINNVTKDEEKFLETKNTITRIYKPTY